MVGLKLPSFNAKGANRITHPMITTIRIKIKVEGTPLLKL